jgi:hypothetical protein
VQAFGGIWQAIPVQLMWDGNPVIVIWQSKHIRWKMEADKSDPCPICKKPFKTCGHF